MPNYYDPTTPPDSSSWLQLDEAARLAQAEKYHKKHGIRLPNVQAHATFHVIVENQLAMGVQPVLDAIIRLGRQGLSRHDSLHAVGYVLAQHLHEQMRSDSPDAAEVVNARYLAEVERLQADDWVKLQEL